MKEEGTLGTHTSACTHIRDKDKQPNEMFLAICSPDAVTLGLFNAKTRIWVLIVEAALFPQI